MMQSLGPEELAALCQQHLETEYYHRCQEVAAVGLQAAGYGYGDSPAMQELALWKAVAM